MATRLLTKQAANLAELNELRTADEVLPFAPQTLTHVYIKLEFKKEHENARTAEDARGFLSSVSRAATAAHLLAARALGLVLEVQGSLIHVGLPATSGDARQYAAEVNRAYRSVFNNADGRVLGWRITADSGRTLVVAGRGVHGDASLVSLGQSANRPAKHLYAQLGIPEDKRDLKRFHAGIRDSQTGRWKHIDLDTLASHLQHAEAMSIVEAARNETPKLEFVKALQGAPWTGRVAAPLGAVGSQDLPTADRPHTYFGWVMRCDLDGFSARVEECFDNDLKLQELAAQFYALMDGAVQFVNRHPDTMAQLPWAGDNFTAAVLFENREAYKDAATHRLVELPLAFEKDLGPVATASGFGGWAQIAAGGDVHGNSNGNVYLGMVDIRGRRFLVGAGEGFGRSSQALSDLQLRPQDVAVFEPDWDRLDDAYKQAFRAAINSRGEQSTLYRVATARALVQIYARKEALGRPTLVTVPGGGVQEIAPRSYCV